MNTLWFLVKIVNETWMIASHHIAKRYGETFLFNDRPLERFEYLDVMGLFETGWIVYNHTRSGHDFGYPR